MIRSRESLYQMRYYRKKTMDTLRTNIKKLKQEKKVFMDSPEGKAYKKRLYKESGYQEQYREKNKERIKQYQKEYQLVYGTI